MRTQPYARFQTFPSVNGSNASTRFVFESMAVVPSIVAYLRMCQRHYLFLFHCLRDLLSPAAWKRKTKTVRMRCKWNHTMRLLLILLTKIQNRVSGERRRHVHTSWAKSHRSFRHLNLRRRLSRLIVSLFGNSCLCSPKTSSSLNGAECI